MLLPLMGNGRKQQGGSGDKIHINSEGKIMPGESDDIGLISAAEDLMHAISSGDSKRVAEALKAAFMICDSQPHVEGEHE